MKDWPRRVSLVEKFPSGILFNIQCSCGIGDHNAKFWIEFEPDDPELLLLHILGKFNTFFYESKSWKEKIYWFFKRIILSLKWIFLGRIELEEEILISGKDHILALKKALEDSLIYLDDKKEEFKIHGIT